MKRLILHIGGNAGASFGTLSSNQISKAAAYRLKLENLVDAARADNEG